MTTPIRQVADDQTGAADDGPRLNLSDSLIIESADAIRARFDRAAQVMAESLPTTVPVTGGGQSWPVANRIAVLKAAMYDGLFQALAVMQQTQEAREEKDK